MNEFLDKNKKLILIILIIIAIELSGHGIFASLIRFNSVAFALGILVISFAKFSCINFKLL